MQHQRSFSESLHSLYTSLELIFNGVMKSWRTWWNWKKTSNTSVLRLCVCLCVCQWFPEECWQVCLVVLLVGFVARQSLGLRWNWASLALTVRSPPLLPASCPVSPAPIIHTNADSTYKWTHTCICRNAPHIPPSVLIPVVINPWHINPRVCGCEILAPCVCVCGREDGVNLYVVGIFHTRSLNLNRVGTLWCLQPSLLPSFSNSHSPL